MQENLIPIKTKQGTAVIQDTDSNSLPRPLRMLLIMIDGKTSVNHFQGLLTNYAGTAEFGGVENMLDALQELGLIEFKGGQRTRNSIAPAARPDPEIKTQNQRKHTVGAAIVDSTGSEENIPTLSISTNSEQDASLSFEKLKRELVTIVESSGHEDSWELLLDIESANQVPALQSQYEKVWVTLKPGLDKKRQQSMVENFKKLKEIS